MGFIPVFISDFRSLILNILNIMERIIITDIIPAELRSQEWIMLFIIRENPIEKIIKREIFRIYRGLILILKSLIAIIIWRIEVILWAIKDE